MSRRMAFDHRVEFRVRGSTIPSKRFPFERPLGRCGWRCIHAERDIFSLYPLYTRRILYNKLFFSHAPTIMWNFFFDELAIKYIYELKTKCTRQVTGIFSMKNGRNTEKFGKSINLDVPSKTERAEQS